MEKWTDTEAREFIAQFSTLEADDQQEILQRLNATHPPELFLRQREQLRKAVARAQETRNQLACGTQTFPTTIDQSAVEASAAAFQGYAVVLTAGGEGERLRLSLLERGIPSEKLEFFTKATFPLPDFPGDLGTLQINLALLSRFSRESGYDIPVVVTTGPRGTITSSHIPRVMAQHHQFGLRHLFVIPQSERLHLTPEERIAMLKTPQGWMPAVNPDETGGPIMSLKERQGEGPSLLETLEGLGCDKILVLQATALYAPRLLQIMAAAGRRFRCMGVGIRRTKFPSSDPFGTFVELRTDSSRKVLIVEQDVRNETTRQLLDPAGEFHLPFNTGFYALDSALLKEKDLPDFCTPPKEIAPHFPRAPKVGYAAIDIMGLSEHAGVLTVNPEDFAVIKTAEDLESLTALARRHQLQDAITSRR